MSVSCDGRLGQSGATVRISVEHEGWCGAAPEVARRSALAVLAAFAPKARDAEVSLLLTGDGEVASLNRTYRNREGATNVLSFPCGIDGRPPGAPLLLGDIVVAFETTAAEALSTGKCLEDHLAHLVVHGALHLLGFDHEEDGEAARMEGAEVRILAEMGIQNPYRSDEEGGDGPIS